MNNTKYITYFDIEKINITKGALELIKENNLKTSDILLLVERHKFNDDDNIHENDLKENVNAIHNGGMFLSSYNIKGEKIYIISYIDPTITASKETTILLAEEY